MIFGFPQKKDFEELQMRKVKNLELKDKLAQLILDNQNFMKEIGVISTADYWRWRLEFDLKRYSIKDII